ncbi:hypothetical protein Dimus_010826, partial [Dionaea muscipula]
RATEQAKAKLAIEQAMAECAAEQAMMEPPARQRAEQENPVESRRRSILQIDGGRRVFIGEVADHAADYAIGRRLGKWPPGRLVAEDAAEHARVRDEEEAEQAKG